MADAKALLPVLPALPVQTSGRAFQRLSRRDLPAQYLLMFRRLLPFFICLAGVAGASIVRAADAEIVRVWPGWHDADYFERIGEYFGRPAHGGREIVLRTQAADRAGY